MTRGVKWEDGEKDGGVSSDLSACISIFVRTLIDTITVFVFRASACTLLHITHVR